jgi:hypothetical protein
MVPTATFRVLFVLVVLSHARRRVLHFQVTEHPTQEWTMQQIREAFPWQQVPRYLLRDRDAIYGRDFAALTQDMGMEEVVTAATPLVIVWNSLESTSVTPDLTKLFCLLPAFANPYSLGQRCARAPDRGTAGPGACVCDSSGRRTPSPIPASRCLVNPQQRRPRRSRRLACWPG